MPIKCTRVRQSRFIDRDIVFDIEVDSTFGADRRLEKSVKLRKEFTELGMAFHRNRVELRFAVERGNRDSPEWHTLRDGVKEFCDTKLSGYWSWKIKRVNNRENDDFIYEIDLFFEHEADLALWLKDQGQIIKLTY
jgi:hypothetical protein